MSAASPRSTGAEYANASPNSLSYTFAAGKLSVFAEWLASAQGLDANRVKAKTTNQAGSDPLCLRIVAGKRHSAVMRSARPSTEPGMSMSVKTTRMRDGDSGRRHLQTLNG
jgi:hypothetical protein